MTTVGEAKARLEQESIVISSPEATVEKIIRITKAMFFKGYDSVEFIGKVADAQICYIELINAGNAASFEEIAPAVKINLLNVDYIIEDGIVSESATLQASNSKVWEQLDQWTKADSDYFNLKNEESTPPSQQIEALIAASEVIANGSDELEKLQFILRPTRLHEDLLKALMEARGLKMSRVEQGLN